MNPATITMIAIGLGVSLLGGLAAAIVVVKLPQDYFARPPQKASRRKGLGPLLLMIGKNVLGVLLVVAGIVLLLPGVPGPGIVLVLLGLVITDIPGKDKLIHKLVRLRFVTRSMNGVRKRFGRPALVMR